MCAGVSPRASPRFFDPGYPDLLYSRAPPPQAPRVSWTAPPALLDPPPGLPEASLGPAEASLGPAEAPLGPAEASPGPAEPSLGPTEASPGSAEASLGPAEAPPGPTEASLDGLLAFPDGTGAFPDAPGLCPTASPNAARPAQEQSHTVSATRRRGRCGRRCPCRRHPVFQSSSSSGGSGRFRRSFTVMVVRLTFAEIVRVQSFGCGRFSA